MNEVLDGIFILNFTNRQYVSLFSLRWTSLALTWASRNIIPMSTTRLIATCWTLKCNHFHILRSFEVVIKWSFFSWYTDYPPPPSPHAFQSLTAIFTLITCLNVSTACLYLVVKKKNSSEIANHFYNKGTEKSFKWCFVYSVFICQAALMNWVLMWNGSKESYEGVVSLLCHSTCAGVLITTSFCLCLLHAGNASVCRWNP